MRLSKLLDSLEIIKVDNLSDFEIEGITDDSREVRDGFLFVAVSGSRFNGDDFIKEAIERGARVIVTQSPDPYDSVGIPNHELPEKISFIKVKDAHKALWQLAAKFYDYPSGKVKIIGVTGTNGKTTITYLLESIFKQADYSCGVIGTINYRFNDTVIVASNTTPNSAFLQSMLCDMAASGVDYCVLEVSSHSLEQQRVSGVDFKYAIFTNLTSDHLDYHKNRLSYFEAKTKLFKMLNKESYAVINIDDPYGKELVRQTKANVITYGIDNPSDIKAQDLKLSLEGAEFKIKTSRGEFVVNTRLIGRHNVYNILSAVAVAISERVDLEKVIKGIYNLGRVSGRLEKIEGDYPFGVFVDYAHTEDALKNVLISLGNIRENRSHVFLPDSNQSSKKVRGRIIVVFGCGGDRDRSKRSKMGYIASKLADIVIITSDNPRGDEPHQIIQDILSGISKKNENVKIIPDRYSAIEKALSVAEKDDIVLIAGKGHEQCQIFRDREVHFDDRVVVKEVLSKL